MFSVVALLVSVGIANQVAFADVKASVVEQKFAAVTTQKTPTGDYTLGDVRVSQRELSPRQVTFYVDLLESILREQVNKESILLLAPPNQKTSLSYKKEDIHLVAGVRTQRKIQFEPGSFTAQTTKSVLTGPFYLQTATKYCRVFEEQNKNFGTTSFIPTFWKASGSTRLIVECITDSTKSDQGIETYILVLNSKTPDLSETPFYP